METKPLIVVADDDSGDRLLVKLAFEEAGVDVNIIECENGEELITFITTNCKKVVPKFILLDLNMPKKNGIEVLEFMRSTPTICDIPVYIFSTSSDQKDMDRTKALGADDYIVKPFDYNGYVDIARSLEKYL